MQYIVSLLPVLACPLGMGLIMWLMMRGNKDQATHEVNQVPASAHGECVGVPNETPQGGSLLKMIGSCLKMCLNWKVLAGLAVVGVIVWVVAPRLVLAALPLLLVVACPLSMLFMMGGMLSRGNRSPAGGSVYEEQLPQLRSRLMNLHAEQEALSSQIAELEHSRESALSSTETVARLAEEGNQARIPGRKR